MIERERDKYERMHRVPGYSPGPGASYVARVLPLMQPGDRVVDFGAGSGDAALRFLSDGHEVVLVDITDVGLRADPRLRDRFVLASLHDLPDAVPRAEWGFCCDVMEHLPTEWVPAALAGMRKRVERAFFSISGVPDGWGQRIGEVLHLTVKPAAWWTERLSGHWRIVRRLNESNTVFEFLCGEDL